MAKLIVLEVRGLTMEMVQRGDQAAHLFDLIAEGAIAETDGLPSRCGEWIVEDRVTKEGVIGLAGVDALIGELRGRADVAVVSDRVVVYPKPILGLRPGTRLTASQATVHLRRMADGPDRR